MFQFQYVYKEGSYCEIQHPDSAPIEVEPAQWVGSMFLIVATSFNLSARHPPFQHHPAFTLYSGLEPTHMASLLRRLPWSGRAWKPLSFSNINFPRLPTQQRIEEELFPDYVASRYYPVRIGEILKDRYQIVGKLGFGATSTVWLARDLE